MNIDEPTLATRVARGVSKASILRLARLTSKELRETLRDRRTILTLVLMPLLLYPLLSLAGRQVFLAAGGAPVRPVYRIVARPEEVSAIRRLLTFGQDSLEGQGASNEESPEAVSPLDALTGANVASLAPQLEYITATDLEQHVQNGLADVGLSQTTTGAGDGPAIRIEIKLLRPAGAARASALYVQRLLMACNERIAAFVPGRGSLDVIRRIPPLDVRQTEIDAVDRGRGVTLITVAPLILILMTMTGAVYPAIDLTAGERERGTLEILVAAPVPRLSLLLAKYAAVVAVACMTATINLLMMTGAVAISGLGTALLGRDGFSWLVLVQVLLLLLLFATFFSALLLAISSFARSFKEAQAYLVPLMLAALAPGIMSIFPNMRLGGAMSFAPLINIVLLARDILEGNPTSFAVIPVVASTLLYALGAILLAARFFGAEAVLFGSQSGWSHLFAKPAQSQRAPTATAALWCLAILFPLQFTFVSLTSQVGGWSISIRLAVGAAGTAFLFGLLPTLTAWRGNVPLAAAFALRVPRAAAMAGALLLGLSLWTFAHEAIVWQFEIGLGSLSRETMARLEPFLEQIRNEVPLWGVLAAIALAPAVFEELFFRGFLFSALLERSRQYGPASVFGPVVISSLLFGAFHLVSSNSLTFERMLPSTFLGLALGMVRLRSGSVWPGVILHATSNGLLITVAHRHKQVQEWLEQIGWSGGDDRAHLPWTWLVVAAVTASVGAWLVRAGRRGNP